MSLLERRATEAHERKQRGKDCSCEEAAHRRRRCPSRVRRGPCGDGRWRGRAAVAPRRARRRALRVPPPRPPGGCREARLGRERRHELLESAPSDARLGDASRRSAPGSGLRPGESGVERPCAGAAATAGGSVGRSAAAPGPCRRRAGGTARPAPGAVVGASRPAQATGRRAATFTPGSTGSVGGGTVSARPHPRRIGHRIGDLDDRVDDRRRPDRPPGPRRDRPRR